MFKYFFSVVFASICCLSMPHTLSGIVTDQDGTPMPIVNAVRLSATGSSFVAG